MAYLFVGCALLLGTFSCCSKNECDKSKVAAIESEILSDDPLTTLKKGNERFSTDNSVLAHEDLATVTRLSKGQSPGVVVVSCSDSRATPEIVFDLGLGDVFTVRTAGNVMGSLEKGSIEYAVQHAHAKLVVVLGHTHCGAVHALLDHDGSAIPGSVGSILDALKEGEEVKEAMAQGGDNVAYNTIRANVVSGVKQLRTSDPILKSMYDKKEIDIVGAIYDLETGKVEFLDI